MSITTKSLVITQFDVTQRWITMWLGEFASSNTRDSYQRNIGRLFELVDKPLPEMTRHDLLMFRQSLIDKGMGANSRNQAMSAVKSLFKYVSECDPTYLPRNVAASLKLERFESALKYVPLEEETASIFRDVEMHPLDLLAIKFLYYSGIRASELCALKWTDFSESGLTIQVRIEGKGGQVYHTDIPRGLYRELFEMRGNKERVFPFTRRQVYRMVKNAGEAVGINNLSPHCLRHACATHLARAGVQEHVIAEHLGHRNTATTRKYFHNLRDQNVSGTLEAAIERK